MNLRDDNLSWKPPPDTPKTHESEFGWDVQLTSKEFKTLKAALLDVFGSIVVRERNPYKRMILLSRIVQDTGVIVSNVALKYSMEKMEESEQED